MKCNNKDCAWLDKNTNNCHAYIKDIKECKSFVPMSEEALSGCHNINCEWFDIFATYCNCEKLLLIGNIRNCKAAILSKITEKSQKETLKPIVTHPLQYIELE